MTSFDEVEFFTDGSLIEDPYPYFEYLRSKCPVTPTAHYGVVAFQGTTNRSRSTATSRRTRRAIPHSVPSPLFRRRSRVRT